MSNVKNMKTVRVGKVTPRTKAEDQPQPVESHLDPIDAELAELMKEVAEPTPTESESVSDVEGQADLSVDASAGDVEGEDEQSEDGSQDDSSQDYDDGSEAEAEAQKTAQRIQQSLLTMGTAYGSAKAIPTFTIPDGEGEGDVIMLYKPERCLTCSYLVGELVINGKPTIANDRCHFEFAEKDGQQVGNPNCPAQSLRLVRGANFKKTADRLRKAISTNDAAKLATIYGELAQLDASVSRQIITLANSGE